MLNAHLPSPFDLDLPAWEADLVFILNTQADHPLDTGASVREPSDESDAWPQWAIDQQRVAQESQYAWHKHAQRVNAVSRLYKTRSADAMAHRAECMANHPSAVSVRPSAIATDIARAAEHTLDMLHGGFPLPAYCGECGCMHGVKS